MNKPENIIFIRIIKHRLENSKYKIQIEKTEENGQTAYVINFEEAQKDLSKVEINEKINELTKSLISSFNTGMNYPTIELCGEIDDFLEAPTSLLFELFNMITDKQSQKNIYKTLYGHINIIESFNEITHKQNVKQDPKLLKKIIKFLIQEEINEEYKSIVTLHSILGYMSKLNVEDRKDSNEDILKLLQSYKSLIIKKDGENKSNSKISDIRERISLYISNTGIDHKELNKFREFFPVGKNNGHLKKPTANELFIEPQYNVHTIVLSNVLLLAYYPTIIINKDIDKMVEEIIEVIKSKEHSVIKNVEIEVLEKKVNAEEQSILMKINKQDNEEIIIKNMKTIMIGMMDSYQQCMVMSEKERKNYLEKSFDTMTLSIKLSSSDKSNNHEIKKNKI